LFRVFALFLTDGIIGKKGFKRIVQSLNRDDHKVSRGSLEKILISLEEIRFQVTIKPSSGGFIFSFNSMIHHL
jgi:hypothetical protein